MNISEECLRALPVGQFVCFGSKRDMGGQKHDVVIWSWIENQAGFYSSRISAYDVNTGQYICDI